MSRGAFDEDVKMRYLPLNDQDREQMLGKIGVSHIDALFEDVPKTFCKGL